MICIADWPDDLKVLDECKWRFTCGGEHEDTDDFALAWAALLAPPGLPAQSRDGPDQAMLVFKGSRLNRNIHPSCPPHVRKLRERLVSQGKVDTPEWDPWELNADVVFTHPSVAANVLYGGSRNGWDFWKLYRDFRAGPSLTEAVELAKADKLKLVYYRTPSTAFHAEP